MLNFHEMNVLGQICNDTWGKSSTTLLPTMSLKAMVLNADLFEVAYTTVCTFASDQDMRDQKKRFENEAEKLTKDLISKIKKEFKEKAERTLKLKHKETKDAVEIINIQPHINPVKSAYFRSWSWFNLE